MQLTPAIKGQITKALQAESKNQPFIDEPIQKYQAYLFRRRLAVRRVLERIMPREQAKHAARRYLRQVA